MDRKKQRPLVSDFIELEIAKDLVEDKQKIINWLCTHSSSLSNWSNIITTLVLAEMHRKKQANLPYNTENEIFAEVSMFFTKIYYYSDKLHDWNEELKREIERIDKMIDDEIEKQENEGK
jgi:hypothetical protein